jgi:acyl CoA:acetate/3-ketoacid CoA transferase alpha subunit
VGLDRSAAETGKEQTLYYGLLRVLKDATSASTIRSESTLAAIVAGALVAGFALPGLQPACRPKKLHGSGPAIQADLADGGTLARWIRAASAELPCELTRAAAGWTACKMDMNKRIRLNKHVRPCSRAHVVGGR